MAGSAGDVRRRRLVTLQRAGIGRRRHGTGRLGDAVLALVFVLGVVPSGGCAPEVRVVNLTTQAAGRFSFSARTNTVMTENTDGAAEQIRRGWLAESLVASGTCRTGYAVDNQRLVQTGSGIFGNGGDIVYAGHCL